MASMRYVSTRGLAPVVSFSEAVTLGLAPDGGLFVPAELPDLRPHLAAWGKLGYDDLAFEFLRLFADDVPTEELRGMVRAAYTTFDHADRAPLVRLSDDLAVLELFHGPTLAFKDFALQLLGRLYERQVRLTGRPITVLGATSGDTGSAAIHGLLGRPGVRIFILYPNGRVAPLQERQMACTGADNVFPIAIPGSFDDAQKIVKDLFGDRGFVADVGLSAINSINLARVLAQCVYYLWARLRLDEAGQGETEFVVPTGNFGNVLAGWMLSRMQVPGLRFCVATNRNDILHRFFSTGDYSAGSVEPSLAPSMDIQAASNFERYVWFLENGDSARVRAVMADVAAGRGYVSHSPALGSVRSARLDDEGIRAVIARVYADYGYVADPHTACGFAVEPLSGVSQVVLATASPAKFPDTVRAAIGLDPRHPSLDALADHPIVRHELAADASVVRDFVRRHA
ncbi:threonine synthase [Opitutales bacterium ASA1]|uniref:threonine synthase n=1 Tax=Congregicoccus parvus TaxID=3081749 RepID=UPI002B2C2772|nr:threonine synthase [Opitutales bacterium ASA1]